MDKYYSLPYPTLGNRVYLGRVSPKVRQNAINAGLIPTSRKEWGILSRRMQAIERFIYNGEWYDTVKYTKKKR